MSVLFADTPFYDTTFLRAEKRWAIQTPNNSNISVGSTDGPFGDKYIQLGGYNHVYMQKTIGGNPATVIVQFRYRRVSESSYTPYVLRLLENTITHVCLVDWFNLWTVTLSTYNGTTLAQSSVPLVYNAWNYIEFKVTIHNSAGTILLKQNGVTVINASGLDTNNAGTGFVSMIRFGGNIYANQGHNTYQVTHVIVMDTTGSYCNDVLGDRRVQVFRPTGAGSFSEFSPSSGNNYECVDEDPPNDGTDYVTSDTVNERDTFSHGSIANSGATIDAVNCVIYCKTNDGGSAGIKGMAYGSSEGLGPEGAVPSSYGFIESPIYVDPDTSNPFTVSNFNSKEFGYKRSA